jgi:hypothetical protein
VNAPDDDYLHDREQFFTEPVEVVSEETLAKYERLTMTRALLEDYKRQAVSAALQEMDFDDWWTLGFKLGFCGPAVCSTHDGIPMTLEEEHQFELGSDPCVHVIRPYEDLRQKLEVEENHGPSEWRAKGWE